MNTIRLGFTETTLLFYWYLNQENVCDKFYSHNQKTMINWLCTTSGFYDKEIIGSYFDFDANQIKHNNTYNEYFRRLFDFLKHNNNIQLQLCFHGINDTLVPFKKQFLLEIGIKSLHNESSLVNYKPEFINAICGSQTSNLYMDLYSFMQNRNVLIVNNLGSLMKQQFDSGNVKKTNPNFPNNIKSIQYFENGYTFFNKGPDSSILETSEKICNSISKYDCDAVVISAGAYSVLIAKFVLNTLVKNVFIIGGDLPFYFGIKTNRVIKQSNHLVNEYFIEVPAEMRPLGYEKIENGTYW